MAKVELNLTANATDLLNDLNRTEQELKGIQGDAAKAGVAMNKAFAGGEAGAKEFNQEVRKTEGLIEEVERSMKDWQIAAQKATNEKDLQRYNRNIEESRRELERLRKAGTEGMNQVNKSAQRGSQIFTQLKGTIAAAFSVALITNFVKASVRSYDEQAKAEAKLQQALGGRYDLMRDLSLQAEQLQKVTRFADDQIVEAQAQLAKYFKGNTEAIKELLPLILDFATVYEMDLGSAAQLISKTIGSSTNALARYGIEIEGAVGSGERLKSTIEGLNRVVGGQAVKAAEAGAGGYIKLKNAWGDFMEVVGESFTGESSMGKILTSAIEGFTWFWEAIFLSPEAKAAKAGLKAITEENNKFLESVKGMTDEQLIAKVNEFTNALYFVPDSDEKQKQFYLNLIKRYTDVIKRRNEKMAGDEEAIKVEEEEITVIDRLNQSISDLEKQLMIELATNDKNAKSTAKLLSVQKEQLEVLRQRAEFYQLGEIAITQMITKQADMVAGIEKEAKAIKMRTDAAGQFEGTTAKEGPDWFESTFGFAVSPEQKELIKNGLEEVKGMIESWADFQVEQADRVVEAVNSQVEAQQQAVETEIALLNAGYTANVQLEKKKLEDLKLQRQKALEEQEKAVKRQQVIEAITQGVNLATSATEIIKGFAKSTPPWVAVALSAIAIAAMLKLFSSTKGKASGLTKFAKGGLLSGPGHEQGGILIPGTGIEVEGNEFVVNKYAAKKYLPLLETINKDNLPGERKMNIGVNLDDSKQLERIGNLLETKGQRVEYYPGRMVVRKGNNTKTIFLS